MSGLHRAGAKIRVRQLRASAARESRGYVKAIAKIAEAVATGDLAPSEAISMAKVVEIYMHALEAKAFDERLAKVETLAANNAKLPDSGTGMFAPTQPLAEKSL